MAGKKGMRVAAAARDVKVLDYLNACDEPVSRNGIADATRMSRSEAYMALHRLRSRGLVELVDPRKRSQAWRAL